MKVHRLPRGVSGKAYRALVSELIRSQAFFSVVHRPELGFEVQKSSIASALQPFEISRALRTHWPGTRLIQTKALVVLYRAAPELAEVLLAPGDLFAWRAPAFPEDLSFYGSDRICTFSSVAHEREAWVLEKRLASTVGRIVSLTLEDVSQEAFRVISGTG